MGLIMTPVKKRIILRFFFIFVLLLQFPVLQATPVLSGTCSETGKTLFSAYALVENTIIIALVIVIFLLVFIFFRYRKVMERLQESETHFRTTVLNSEAGYFFIDNNGIIRDVNGAWLKLYGYNSPDEILGRDFAVIQRENDVEKAREIVGNLLSGKISHLAGEFSRKLRDGGLGYHTFSARPVRYRGKIIGLEGFIIDTTARRNAEDAILERERMLNRSQAIAHVGHWAWDIVNNKVSLSDEMFRIFGISREISADNLTEIIETTVHPDDRGLIRAIIETAKRGSTSVPVEYRVIWPDSSVHYVWARPGDRVKDSNGNVIYLSGTVQDITERKQVENALRESEAQYYELFNNMSTAVAVYEAEESGENFIFRDFNRAGLDIEKIDKESVIGRRVTEVFPGVVEFGLFDVFRRVWKTGIPEFFPVSLYKDNRIQGWRDNYVYKLPSGTIVAMYTDETARKQSQEALRASLEEKTILLKEVHHRVKNNLQIVSSLVNLQANHTRNEEARSILQETCDRIRSMAMLHETLYKLDVLSSIDFSSYITNICTYLMRSYGTKTSGIQLEQKLEKVTLGIDQAISCGLIVNELVSNALKHAFEGRQSGRIIVGVKALPDSKVILSVEDNGIGMRPGTDIRQTGTLGFELVHILSLKLEGTLEIECSEGTAFHLYFLPKK